MITSGPANVVWRQPRRAAGSGLRQRAWNVMGLTKTSFTVPDLIVASARGDELDAEDNLRRYCAVLVKAGYLRRLPGRDQGSRHGSNGFVRFRVVKHSGPLAPTHRSRAGKVRDHNTGEEVAL